MLPKRHQDWVLAYYGLENLIGLTLTGCVAMWIRDQGLRRAIAKRLEGARCGRCKYSLLGLAVVGGNVLCPECGHFEALGDRGLSAADILGVEGATKALV
jgi:hypothetical protein